MKPVSFGHVFSDKASVIKCWRNMKFSTLSLYIITISVPVYYFFLSKQMHQFQNHCIPKIVSLYDEP